MSKTAELAFDILCIVAVVVFCAFAALLPCLFLAWGSDAALTKMGIPSHISAHFAVWEFAGTIYGCTKCMRVNWKNWKRKTN